MIRLAPIFKRFIILTLLAGTSFQSLADDLFIPLVPYRSGNLWGLANMQGEVILTPQYDTMFPARLTEHETYFRVRKNGKWGFLHLNEEVIPCEIGKSFRSYSTSLLFDYTQDEEGNRTGRVYTFAREKPYGDSLVNIADYQIFIDFTIFSILRSDGRYDILVIEREKNKVHTHLHLKADEIRINYNGSMDHLFTVIKKGKSFRLARVSEENYNFRFNLLPLSNPETDLEEIPEFEISEAMPHYDRNGYYGNDRTAIAVKADFYWEINSGTQLELRCKMSRQDDGPKMKVDRDSLIARVTVPDTSWYWEYYTNPTGYVYQYRNLSELEIRRGDTIYKMSDRYLVFESNGLKGFITETAYMEAQFDSIKYIADIYGRSRYFLVRIPNDKGARYGLIDHLGTWVLKPEYEHLDPQLRLNMWIVSGRKDNLQGIFLLKEDPFWLISCKYDSIEILDPERGRNFFSFILESKSLYGLKLYPEHRAWGIPPFFKYKTTGAEMICRQTLYLMYEGERFLGYADKSGRYYFED